MIQADLGTKTSAGGSGFVTYYFEPRNYIQQIARRVSDAFRHYGFSKEEIERYIAGTDTVRLQRVFEHRTNLQCTPFTKNTQGATIDEVALFLQRGIHTTHSIRRNGELYLDRVPSGYEDVVPVGIVDKRFYRNTGLAGEDAHLDWRFNPTTGLLCPHLMITKNNIRPAHVKVATSDNKYAADVFITDINTVRFAALLEEHGDLSLGSRVPNSGKIALTGGPYDFRGRGLPGDVYCARMNASGKGYPSYFSFGGDERIPLITVTDRHSNEVVNISLRLTEKEADSLHERFFNLDIQGYLFRKKEKEKVITPPPPKPPKIKHHRRSRLAYNATSKSWETVLQGIKIDIPDYFLPSLHRAWQTTEKTRFARRVEPLRATDETGTMEKIEIQHGRRVLVEIYGQLNTAENEWKGLGRVVRIDKKGQINAFDDSMYVPGLTREKYGLENQDLLVLADTENSRPCIKGFSKIENDMLFGCRFEVVRSGDHLIAIEVFEDNVLKERLSRRVVRTSGNAGLRDKDLQSPKKVLFSSWKNLPGWEETKQWAIEHQSDLVIITASDVNSEVVLPGFRLNFPQLFSGSPVEVRLKANMQTPAISAVQNLTFEIIPDYASTPLKVLKLRLKPIMNQRGVALGWRNLGWNLDYPFISLRDNAGDLHGQFYQVARALHAAFAQGLTGTVKYIPVNEDGTVATTIRYKTNDPRVSYLSLDFVGGAPHRIHEFTGRLDRLTRIRSIEIDSRHGFLSTKESVRRLHGPYRLFSELNPSVTDPFEETLDVTPAHPERPYPDGVSTEGPQSIFSPLAMSMIEIMETMPDTILPEVKLQIATNIINLGHGAEKAKAAQNELRFYLELKGHEL